ncbi:3-phosphoshikimate 1-carboxyvinyltransferase [Lichenicoccus sp.]|uniref:3-phosphoshikimate 1-carboxyvinyltransferase n=1 Tax=Lichenicoccus sp. TaxID=2781899 RepID=UPI003D14C700
MALRVIPPRRPLRGRVTPPGSKSITNRMLLLAALATGESRLTGALKSDDTARMATALRAMGVGIDEPDPTGFVVRGHGRLAVPDAPLELGNAGTAMRFLAAACALVPGRVVLDGDAHMRTRPIAPLLAALGQLGVRAHAATGCPPVRIEGDGRLAGGRVVVDGGLSSQYVSALLMLAACGEAPIEVALAGGGIGARGYIDLTLAAMRRFGAAPHAVDEACWLVPPTGYRGTQALVEPDASAATYFWAASALTGGAIDLGVEAFTQPDAMAASLIARFPDMPPIIDGAQMQDAVPTLAVLAAFNRTPVRFTGIANLRVKECDRVRALATQLSRIRTGLGCELGDDLLVDGSPSLASQCLPTRIETYRDHRIAMSFALAGLVVDGITILDPGCVAKTFPGYWDALRGLGVDFMETA